MKKHFFTLTLLALTILSYGQIVITNDDIAPVGTTIFMANDTVPADEIVPGDAGADKSWDFINVVAHTIDTMDFVMPASTPYADEFPASNFAIDNSSEQDSTDLYFYMTRNSDKMASLGFVGESPGGVFIWKVTPEDVILDFPVTYQNSYSENYTEVAVFSSPQPGADSVRLKNTTSKQTDVDAWGTLSIPMGTFDVLRQRIDEVTTDSVFVLIGGNWLFISRTQDSTTSYSWWTDDAAVGFQLFGIEIDKSNGEITDVSFMSGTTVGVADHPIVESRAYPNPVTDVLNIEFEKPVSGELVLLNQLGQQLRYKQLSSAGRVSLDLSQLPKGIYFYRVGNNAGEIIANGKIIKR